MCTILSTLNSLLVIGLIVGFAGLTDAQANTSAEEVLKDIAMEDISETAPVTEVDAEATETLEQSEADADALESSPQAVELPTDDYGDAVLNQLYSE